MGLNIPLSIRENDGGKHNEPSKCPTDHKVCLNKQVNEREFTYKYNQWDNIVVLTFFNIVPHNEFSHTYDKDYENQNHPSFDWQVADEMMSVLRAFINYSRSQVFLW